MVISSAAPSLHHLRHQSQDVSDDIDIIGFFSVLWRYKRVILLLSFLGFCGGLILTHFKTPLFRAETLVILNSGQAPSALATLGQTLSLGGAGSDSAYITAQLEILKSRDMAQHVIEDMGLMDGQHKMLVSSASGEQDQQGGYFKSFSLYADQKALPPLAAPDRMLNAKINEVLEHLTVKAMPASSVVRLGYSADDPQRAADIANRFIALYQRLKERERRLSSWKLFYWLDKQKDALLKEIRESEEKLLRFQQENHIFGAQSPELKSETILQLQQQLQEAQKDLAKFKILVAYLDSFEKDDAALRSLPEVLNSPVVQQLKAEIALARQAMSELATRYGPKHPAMVQAQQNLDALSTALAEEMQLIKAGIDNQYKLAQQHVTYLEEEITKAASDNFGDFDTLVQLQLLKSDVESKHIFYNKLLEGYQMLHSDHLKEDPVKIISRAVPAERPYSPRKKLFAALGLMLGFLAGLLYGLIHQRLDRAFRTAEDLEGFTHVPCFGAVPHVMTSSAAERADYIVKYPASLLAESVRTLRSSMKLRGKDGVKTVCVTSSFTGEGKTTLSIWLARAAMQAGERSILIDCDFRRPNVHKTLGQPNELTLVDYLTGNAALEDIIYKDALTGLPIIYARAVPNTALNLMSGAVMAQLMDDLRAQYDLVVLDAPACLAVGDAKILADLADFTLYAVRWAKTPDYAVSRGIKQLTDIKAKVASILTQVDMRRHAAYGGTYIAPYIDRS